MAKVQVFKQVIWSLKYADQQFSNFIRTRDGQCMRCCRNDKPLDCSHYWRRDMWGTRFNPLNCIALCRDCHTIWERQQNFEYREWMIKWIGEEEYWDLERMARTMKKRRDAIAECMEFIKTNR